jgi:hypothetical protein
LAANPQISRSSSLSTREDGCRPEAWRCSDVARRDRFGGHHEVLLRSSTTAIEKSSLHWSVSTRRSGRCCETLRFIQSRSCAGKDRAPRSSSSVRSGLASHATSNGLIRPKGRQRPRSPSRNGYACFFPLPPRGGIPRGRQKSSLTPSSASAAGLTAAGRSLPGPTITIEAAMGAA